MSKEERALKHIDASALPWTPIPSSDSIVKVHIINAGELVTRKQILTDPGNNDPLPLPDYTFFIEHEKSGRRIVFDLALMKDLSRYPPSTQKLMDTLFKSKVDKDTAETLTEGGVDLGSIEAVILSHAHMDHVGDIWTFPDNVALIVGPGTLAKSLPAYPENQKAMILSKQLPVNERSVFEVLNPDDKEGVKRGLDKSSPIGSYARAVDYFGDGSFYLCDAPGHYSGHMVGLARTTKDTFIVMGGDTCHDRCLYHPPSQGLRPKIAFFPSIAGSGFGTMHGDVATAYESIGRIERMDQQENIMVILAHEGELLNVVDFYPKTANDWKKKGWKESANKMTSRM